MDNDIGKLNQAVNFLSTASPQQMSLVGQMLQNNPKADPIERLAFMIASNQQQAARSPNPPMPQQTVFEQRLAKTQGIPNVAPNQMALQQAAAQNPNMAGIAAAPENVPGAATGGLVSFAQGGEVRGYSDGQTVDLSDFAAAPVPGMPTQQSGFEGMLTRFTDTPFAQKFAHWATTPGVLPKAKTASKDSAVSSARGIPSMGVSDEALGITSPEDKYSLSQDKSENAFEKAFPTPKFGGIPAAKPKAAPEMDTEEGEQEEVGEPKRVDPSSVNKVSGVLAAGNGLSPEEQINRLSKMFNVDHGVAAELKGKWEKEIADSEKSNILSAIAAGTGAMLAGGPNKPAAIGQGLMALVGQYGKGEEEQRAMKRQMAGLDLQQEAQARAAQQEAAKLYLQDMMEQRKAKAAAQAGLASKASEFQHDVALQNLKGTQSMSEAELAAKNRMDIARLEAASKDIMQKFQPNSQQDLLNAVIKYAQDPTTGMTMEDIEPMFQRMRGLIQGGGSSAPASQSTLRPLGGGLFLQ